MFAITERLLLRPGWAEDAPALSRAIGEEEVVRNLSRAPWPYALGDAERFLSMPQKPCRPHLLVFLRDCARLIGGVGLNDTDRADQAELGYWLAREQWGQGYATEAARALVAMADESLRLPQLQAAHALDNPASGRVLQKLGFRPAGAGTMHSAARGTEMPVRFFTRERVPHRPAPIAQPLAA
jgi:RimJ/RimL family protein N-acetyltransferase